MIINKRQRIPKWQSKMDNPEKLATQSTQDEEKQSREIGNIRVHKTKKNNPEKLATQSTQDEVKKTKAQNNMCWTPLFVNKHKDTTIRKQTQII